MQVTAVVAYIKDIVKGRGPRCVVVVGCGDGVVMAIGKWNGEHAGSRATAVICCRARSRGNARQSDGFRAYGYRIKIRSMTGRVAAGRCRQRYGCSAHAGNGGVGRDAGRPGVVGDLHAYVGGRDARCARNRCGPISNGAVDRSRCLTGSRLEQDELC